MSLLPAVPAVTRIIWKKAKPVLQHPERTYQIQPEKVLYFINFHELQFSLTHLKKKNLEYVNPLTRVSTIFTQMHDDSNLRSTKKPLLPRANVFIQI